MAESDKQTTQDDGLIRRAYSLDFNDLSIDRANRSVEFVFSDDSIDSYDEVVEQDWDLSRYQKNPVVLYNHNRSSFFDSSPKHSLPIGRSENVRVENGKLQGRVFLATEKANPLAEQCWQLLLEKILRAGSVGFIPGDVIEEKRDGKEVYRLRKNKLFEFSLTPIGANENALANSIYSERDAALLRSYAKRALSITSPPLGGNGENEMEIKELQAEVERLKGANEVLEKRASEADLALKSSVAELETVRAKCVELELANKELSEKNATSEGQVIAAEVTALVGKKIAPAQVEKFIKLRVDWGKGEFDEFVKSMPDMAYTKTITNSSSADATNTSTGRKVGQPKVLAAALKAAEKAAGEDVTVES